MRALVESLLVEWSIYVDKDGMAHTDEGDSWFVGKSVREGEYTGDAARRLVMKAINKFGGSKRRKASFGRRR